MSDFDKEAEREKLREKYEQDKEERKATQRMSDLLLKGATMTNAHCGTCGDPLFQHEGTTFCPSCHGNPDAVEGRDSRRNRPTNSQRRDSPRRNSRLRSSPLQGSLRRTNPLQGSLRRTSRPTTVATVRRGPMRRPRTRSTLPTLRLAVQPTPTGNRPLPAGDEPTRGPSAAIRDVRFERRVEVAVDSNPAVGRGRPRDRTRRARPHAREVRRGGRRRRRPRYARDCLEAAREAGETLSTLR